LFLAVIFDWGGGGSACNFVAKNLQWTLFLIPTHVNVPKIIDKYVENIFSDIYWIQKNGKKMEITEIPHHDYPDNMIPLVHHHYSERSQNIISENITFYLRLIMFGSYNVETKNVMDTLACEVVAFDLFDNELMVVTISRTALSMVTTYSHFMEQTCKGVYFLIHVNRGDQTFYHNMFLFIFTGQLLERVK
jgi:hypothetical protein